MWRGHNESRPGASSAVLRCRPELGHGGGRASDQLAQGGGDGSVPVPGWVLVAQGRRRRDVSLALRRSRPSRSLKFGGMEVVAIEDGNWSVPGAGVRAAAGSSRVRFVGSAAGGTFIEAPDQAGLEDGVTLSGRHRLQLLSSPHLVSHVVAATGRRLWNLSAFPLRYVVVFPILGKLGQLV